MPSKKGKEGHFEPTPLKRLATNLPNEEFLERKLGYFTSEDGGLFATNSEDEPTGDYIYYFGVIDLLTTVFSPQRTMLTLKYGVKKHLETLFKGFSFPKNELSAVPPDQYADRFVRFIRTNVNPKDIPHYTTRHHLSHIAIAEESPVTTPSAQEREKSPSITAAGDVNVVRTVICSPDHPGQKLPAITVQRPSPELKDGVFEREIVNGVEKLLLNGLGGD
jgi:Phosphatidylinositol-4-phosphate 5-Kinase